MPVRLFNRPSRSVLLIPQPGYHIVIVQLHGQLAWDFIGSFLKKLNDSRGNVNMVPDIIGLATVY